MNMKKTLIAAGVAVAMAAPMAATADVSLTAQLQTEIVNLSGDGLTANGNGWYIGDAWSGGSVNAGNFSRIDLRGSHDIGNGLTAFGHLSMNLNVFEGNLNNAPSREVLAGLRGDFGQVRVGRMTTQYFTSNKDPFHGTFMQARGNGGMIGAFGGLGNGSYLNQAIDYVGTFNPVTIAGTFGIDNAADGDSDDTNGEHMYALRAEVDLSPVTVWAAWTNADEYRQPGGDGDDFSAWKIGASWSDGPFGVMAQYEDITHEDTDGNDLGQAGQYAMVTGTYTMGANRFMLGYGQFSAELDDSDARWIALGMRHTFTRQVSVHAGVRQTSFNDNDDKETAVGAGMRVVF